MTVMSIKMTELQYKHSINQKHNLIIICDQIWEKGPYRASNDFSV